VKFPSNSDCLKESPLRFKADFLSVLRNHDAAGLFDHFLFLDIKLLNKGVRWKKFVLLPLLMEVSMVFEGEN